MVGAEGTGNGVNHPHMHLVPYQPICSRLAGFCNTAHLGSLCKSELLSSSRTLGSSSLLSQLSG